MRLTARAVGRALFLFLIAPLLGGCVYVQYLGLFPTSGDVEASPDGKTIVAGVMVDEHGAPLAGLVMLEQGVLHRGKFRRGGIVDPSGRFAVEVPEGGDWGLHGYSDHHIYHPEAIKVVASRINRFRWVLPADKVSEDNPRIANITITPEPAPGATITMALEAFDPKRRLSEQVLVLNARTGEALVMDPRSRHGRAGRSRESSIQTGSTARPTARCRRGAASRTGSSCSRTKTAASLRSRSFEPPGDHEASRH